MTQKRLLEISVETLAGALAAERGGADRLELCADLSVGGITPSGELMRTARAQVRIPIFAMIRPRGGDFVYSIAECAEMRQSIAQVKESGMDGVVLGILKKDRAVDIDRTRELIDFARPLPATFHRAFDETADLPQALEDVIQTGAARILTSGGAPTAREGAAILVELVRLAGKRIIILPGSDIHPGNVLDLATRTRANEFHSGLSSVLPRRSQDFALFEKEVSKLSTLLAGLAEAP